MQKPTLAVITVHNNPKSTPKSNLLGYFEIIFGLLSTVIAAIGRWSDVVEEADASTVDQGLVEL